MPHITERLAIRVKGLTAVFRVLLVTCVLLVTNPARTCLFLMHNGCGKKSLVAASA